MAYPKLTPIVANGATEPRYLGDRFADVVNVKDFGAKGDGITDDTEAFAQAAETGKALFIPNGEYVLSQPLPKNNLYGDGVIKYTTGQTWSVNNVVNSELLGLNFNGELSLSSGKMVQDCSICDGYFFTSQQISGTAYTSDSVVRISRYALPLENKSLEGLSPAASTFPTDVLTPIDTCDFTGFGHGEGVSAIKENGEIYIYAQLSGDDSTVTNFAKIKWAGSASTYVSYIGLPCVRGQTSVSIDGKYLLVCHDYGETRATIGNGSYIGVTIFDRSEVENAVDITSVKPKFAWYNSVAANRSAVSCDGRHVYLLASSGTSPSMQDEIFIFTLDGKIVKHFKYNHMASILENEYRYGWNGYYPVSKECEGIAFYKGRIYSVGKIIWAQPVAVVKFEGNTYISRDDSTGITPYNDSYWAPTRATIQGASNYSLTTSYTGSGGYSHRYVVSIDAQGQYPVAGGAIFDVSGQAQITTSPGRQMTIAVEDLGEMWISAYNSNVGQLIPFVHFYYNGGIHLRDIRGFTANGYDIKRKYRGCYLRSDSETDTSFVGTYSATGDASSGYSLGAVDQVEIEFRGAENTSASHSLRLGRGIYIYGCSSDFNPGTVAFYSGVNSTSKAAFFNTSRELVVLAAIKPNSSGIALGASGSKWSNVYAETGPWASSDERLKDNISAPSEELLTAWGKVGFKLFQFKTAISEKGENARIHTGIIAQDVMSAFESEGLDVSRYGLFGYDEWGDEYVDEKVVDSPEVRAKDGEIIEQEISHIEHRKSVSAGNSFSIRYEEALVLECAYLRSRISKMQEQIDTLTQRVNQLTNNTNN